MDSDSDLRRALDEAREEIRQLRQHNERMGAGYDEYARRLHPTYGPCDGFGERGTCAACRDALDKLKGENLEWLAAARALDDAATEEQERRALFRLHDICMGSADVNLPPSIRVQLIDQKMAADAERDAALASAATLRAQLADRDGTIAAVGHEARALAAALLERRDRLPSGDRRRGAYEDAAERVRSLARILDALPSVPGPGLPSMRRPVSTAAPRSKG